MRPSSLRDRLLQRQFYCLLERQGATLLPRAVEGSVISQGRARRGDASVVLAPFF